MRWKRFTVGFLAAVAACGVVLGLFLTTRQERVRPEAYQRTSEAGSREEVASSLGPADESGRGWDKWLHGSDEIWVQYDSEGGVTSIIRRHKPTLLERARKWVGL